LAIVEISEGQDVDFLRINTGELEVGESVRIPFRVERDEIKRGFRYEKWDVDKKKFVTSKEPGKGFRKVFYRKIHLVDEDRDVIYKFSSQLNESFLARVAEVLLDGKKVEETTFVLYAYRFGEEKLHVRYSIFIEQEKKGGKKLVKKKKQSPDAIIKDVLIEFGYEADRESIEYVKENIDGEITREAVKAFLESEESEE